MAAVGNQLSWGSELKSLSPWEGWRRSHGFVERCKAGTLIIFGGMSAVLCVAAVWSRANWEFGKCQWETTAGNWQMRFVNDCRGALGEKNCNPTFLFVCLFFLHPLFAAFLKEMPAPEPAFPKIPVEILPGTFQGAPRDGESSFYPQESLRKVGDDGTAAFCCRSIPRMKAHPPEANSHSASNPLEIVTHQALMDLSSPFLSLIIPPLGRYRSSSVGCLLLFQGLWKFFSRSNSPLLVPSIPFPES